jgi:hypothetical protein
MGNEKIGREIVEVLLGKGYRWPGYDQNFPRTILGAITINTIANGSIAYFRKGEEECGSLYKELTFRELCELPPVHDEYEEAAKEITDFLINKLSIFDNNEFIDFAIKKIDWCKIWEKMKPKLGL